MRTLTLLTTLALAAPATAQALGLSACQSACGFRLTNTLNAAPRPAQTPAIAAAARTLQADGYVLNTERIDALGNRTQVWHNPRVERWARVDITRSGRIAIERSDTPPAS